MDTLLGIVIMMSWVYSIMSLISKPKKYNSFQQFNFAVSITMIIFMIIGLSVGV